MNIQNLFNQLKMASNPQQMLMSMMNPQQKQMFQNLKSKGITEEEAEKIAKVCNEKGITKEQFQTMCNLFNK